MQCFRWFGFCLEPHLGHRCCFCRRLTILEAIFFRICKFTWQVKADEHRPMPDAQWRKGFYEQAPRLALLDFISCGFQRNNLAYQVHCGNLDRWGQKYRSRSDALRILRVSDIANTICVLRDWAFLLVNEHCGSLYSDDRISYTFLYFSRYIIEVGELQYRFEQLFEWVHHDVLCYLLVQRKCRCDADDWAFNLPSWLDPQFGKAFFIRRSWDAILEFPSLMRL